MHPDTNRETRCYVYRYNYLQLVKHMCKATGKFREIEQCSVHTCLAAFVGTGDASRISMTYKWQFCRSHIFPLLSVRYRKTNSLNRNSGTPLRTCPRKRHKGISFLLTTSPNHETAEGGKNLWRISRPTPAQSRLS